MFEIKTQVIGSEGADLRTCPGPVPEGTAVQVVQEGRVLNRVIRSKENGWEYEGDRRRGEIIVRAHNLDEAKEVGTPGEEAKPWKAEEEEEQ